MSDLRKVSRLTSRESTTILALIVAFAGACSDSGSRLEPGAIPSEENDAGGNGAGAPNLPPLPDGGLADCGEQQEEIELLNLGDPPDLMIVLDRSGSMGAVPPPENPLDLIDPTAPSRWEIMVDALTELTEERRDNIHFGLSLFPGFEPVEEGCSPPARIQQPAADTADSIQSSLASMDEPNGGGTPAHAGLADALEMYSALPINPAGRFVLFATDGSPNCAGDGVDADEATVAQITALSEEGIPTYVLGFALGFGFDNTILNDAAEAGGTARPGGPPFFYSAGSAEELTAALDEIAGGIIPPSCSYGLADTPPEPDKVTVLADGVAVPRDTNETDGWNYSPDDQTITFFGSYCQSIESGSIASVKFLFGCTGPVVE